MVQNLVSTKIKLNLALSISSPLPGWGDFNIAHVLGILILFAKFYRLFIWFFKLLWSYCFRVNSGWHFYFFIIIMFIISNCASLINTEESFIGNHRSTEFKIYLKKTLKFPERNNFTCCWLWISMHMNCMLFNILYSAWWSVLHKSKWKE